MTPTLTEQDHNADQLPLQDSELEVLTRLVPLGKNNILELGCGNARFARALLDQYPACKVTGLEVDARQHAKNLLQPQDRLTFLAASAEHIPFDAATFDLALMLKSLHHVPIDVMDAALDEVARVLKPGGCLFVSEPIYAGALNEVVRCYNDEGAVRAAAQAALDRALAKQGPWLEAGGCRFAQAVSFRDFDEFEQRMMRPTFVDLAIDDAKRDQTRTTFERYAGSHGARFVRPMHVRLLQRCPEVLPIS